MDMKLAHASGVYIPTATNVDFFSEEPCDIPEIIVHDYRLRTCMGLDDRNHQIIQDGVTMLVQVRFLDLGSVNLNSERSDHIATRLGSIEETRC